MKIEKVFGLLSLAFIIFAFIAYPVQLLPYALIVAGINFLIVGWNSLSRDRDKSGYFYLVVSLFFAAYGGMKFFT
ncbi:hypothetical protein H0266_14940 [Halobacillus locisalis]|uniref:DUF3953 domain-containing protein n=1 Tax=Halobacillus locisalis TaxID=220753 RepID=A0A838CWA2_9BACI|nr:hypothetical protein [Halobacillus locisalis]MBA2176191.1 hypothetical protein [Halobacillus locisalis]